MAIDTHRAAYNKPNPSLRCGSPKPLNLSPTITVEEKSFYTVRYSNGTLKQVQTLSQVNDIIRVHPSVKVVKTTRTVTTETRRKQIR